MGCCSSDASTTADKAERRKEKERNKALEQKMQVEQNNEQLINKLLLLGAGESGKSTLFKQMITLYGQGFTEQDRLNYITVIHGNIVTAIKTLTRHAPVHSDGVEISKDLDKAVRIVDELKTDDDDLSKTPEVADCIAALWADPAIQRTYENRAKFQLYDSAKYFLDRVHEITQPNYVPSQQDVLRSRVRTTGIVENEFDIEGNKFKMYDVGGQRNERKKWIHCFENVTAVIFVAAISEYDQVLYEDESTNRMTEALNLFDEICNSRWFRETSIILFLNKRDIFEDKLEQVPLTVCFPEYDGPNTFDHCSAYIRDQFERRNRSAEKVIYTHVTCATDTSNISTVFNAVKDIIIRQSLNEAGLA